MSFALFSVQVIYNFISSLDNSLFDIILNLIMLPTNEDCWIYGKGCIWGTDWDSHEKIAPLGRIFFSSFLFFC